ncbi:hypothetical protein L1987_21358 [Smallanthus sonchifolius]|uniref:Uncharacterized protein n=1 Tax=Smallanthus sonchifolius TaxID=185202 RepID=A0ACB9IX96_9ASTR|nr:hypothetical protein L1987_21358 [Smallanthus sonchifolius]
MRNHQEPQQDHQEPMVSMDFKKNPNLETNHNKHHHVLPSPSSSSQDFKRSHLQHNTHISKRTHEEDEGFIFKNACEVIKNPNFLSCSSLVAGDGYMPPPRSPPPPQDFKKAQHQHNIIHVSKKPNSLSCSSLAAGEGGMTTPSPAVEESGRERLKRHRVEMAGRVWIPDIWGHEDLLKDWIDCSVFDSSLGNKTIMSARAALIQEGRSTVRIENQC